MISNEYIDKEILLKIQGKGYLIIENFFHKSELQSCWDGIDSLAKSFAKRIGLDLNKFDGLIPEERDRMLVLILKERPDLQSLIYNRLQMIPSLLALPSHKKFKELSTILLQTSSYGVWPRLQVRLDLYNDEKNVIGWHHDYLYNKGTKSSYTFWMPLVSITKEMGTLLLAEQSHKLDLEDLKFEPIDNQRRFVFSLNPETLKNLELFQKESFSAGDLVIFHSMLIHSGMLNTLEDRARLTVLFRMQNLEKLEGF